MDDISNIIGNLSGEDIDKLKNLASDIFGEKEETSERDNFSIDPQLMSRVASILSMLNKTNENDDRTAFLSSLKPLLSEKRQKKADEAMKMMRIFDALPLLRESGIF